MSMHEDACALHTDLKLLNQRGALHLDFRWVAGVGW